MVSPAGGLRACSLRSSGKKNRVRRRHRSRCPEEDHLRASGQLALNAGSFKSGRGGFADYPQDAETATQPRARVDHVTSVDWEAMVLALHAPHPSWSTRLEAYRSGTW